MRRVSTAATVTLRRPTGPAALCGAATASAPAPGRPQRRGRGRLAAHGGGGTAARRRPACPAPAWGWSAVLGAGRYSACSSRTAASSEEVTAPACIGLSRPAMARPVTDGPRSTYDCMLPLPTHTRSPERGVSPLRRGQSHTAPSLRSPRRCHRTAGLAGGHGGGAVAGGASVAAAAKPVCQHHASA